MAVSIVSTARPLAFELTAGTSLAPDRLALSVMVAAAKWEPKPRTTKPKAFRSRILDIMVIEVSLEVMHGGFAGPVGTGNPSVRAGVSTKTGFEWI